MNPLLMKSMMMFAGYDPTGAPIFLFTAVMLILILSVLMDSAFSCLVHAIVVRSRKRTAPQPPKSNEQSPGGKNPGIDPS